MRTAHVLILSIALVTATAVASAAAVFANRYTMVALADSHIVWKLDRVTGQSYGCEESEFGPFCIPAPDHIKHAP
jgi:hypothetical protein